jgi:peptidoglycan/LPS O-acetylase OafA/YrhL
MLRTRSAAGVGRITAVLAVACAVGNCVIAAGAAHSVHKGGFLFRANYFTPLGHAASLLAGSAIALAPPRSGRLLSALAAAGGILILAFFFVAPGLHQSVLWYGPQQLFVLAAAGVIAHQAIHRFRPLAAAPIVWIGRRSYGIYLWHQVILVAVAHELTHASGLTIALIGIPLSIAVAELSYRLVERPFLRLKVRFARVPDTAVQMPADVAVVANVSPGTGWADDRRNGANA